MSKKVKRDPEIECSVGMIPWDSFDINHAELFAQMEKGASEPRAETMSQEEESEFVRKFSEGFCSFFIDPSISESEHKECSVREFSGKFPAKSALKVSKSGQVVMTCSED